MSYHLMDDATLARRAYIELDPLVSTDLERELLTRLERSNDDAARVHLLDDAELDTVEDVRNVLALAALLGDFGIDTPQALRRLLERDRRMRALIPDLQQAFAAEE